MNNHTTTVIPLTDQMWRGRCSCRETSPNLESHWKAEQWGIEHRKKIDRIRLHLDKQPSLPVAYKMFESASENSDLTDEQRALFRMMATELKHRLYGPDNPPEQLPLFDQPERNSHGTSTRRRTTRPTGH